MVIYSVTHSARKGNCGSFEARTTMAAESRMTVLEKREAAEGMTLAERPIPTLGAGVKIVLHP